MHTKPRLAILIDADNAQAPVIGRILTKAAALGVCTVKRAYGDWTTPRLSSWKAALNASAIQPMQQFGYTTGKNSTDSALIIDAMDLLYAGKLDGFFLVSSDCDFTRLATRLRESGMVVYGAGERRTAKAFVAACDTFFHVDTLKPAVAAGKPAAVPTTSKKHAASKAADPVLKALPQTGGETTLAIDLGQDASILRAAISALIAAKGVASLGELGALLAKDSPSLTAKKYGCASLGKLLKRVDFVELIMVPGPTPPHMLMQVRIKKGQVDQTSVNNATLTLVTDGGISPRPPASLTLVEPSS